MPIKNILTIRNVKRINFLASASSATGFWLYRRIEDTQKKYFNR